MLRTLNSRWGTALGAAIVALVVAGGAFAYLGSTGSGSGSASVGSPEELTITAVIPTAGLLFPGGTGDVDATISNPNTFSVRVNSLILGSVGISADSAHSECDSSALHFTTQNNGAAGWTIPAKVGSTDGSLDVDLAGAINMDADVVNECQGATFTVSLATGP